MVSALANLAISFGAGLFAPVAAVCVLPLYPGFLAYLAGQASETQPKTAFIRLGLLVTAGIIVSMLLVGLIVTFLFQSSLTSAIQVISPIAFGILGIASLLLIFNADPGRLFPKIHSPVGKNPYLSSFLFGFFFGAIILPCNPASLVVLFAISTSVAGFIANLLNFIVFGIGMSMPLLALAVAGAAWSAKAVRFLATYRPLINRAAGVIMLGISSYYLIFVFRIFG